MIINVSRLILGVSECAPMLDSGFRKYRAQSATGYWVMYFGNGYGTYIVQNGTSQKILVRG